MTRVILALGLLAGVARGDGLLIEGGKATFQLRISLTTEGESSEAAWGAFLDRAFGHFDRDGDGSLSRAEAGRMFAFPLPGRRELAVNFGRLDAGGDGKASREELKAFCRRGGFTPVVLIVEPPTSEDQRLAEVLTRHLDTAKDGKVSEAELKRATSLLDRFDADEDEALDRAELLALAGPGAAVAGRVKGATVRNPDATLSVDFSAKGTKVKLEGGKEKLLRLMGASAPGRPRRLGGPAGDWSITLPTSRAAPGMREANEFVLAQFEAALDGRAALTREDVEADATLSGLRDLFPFADRDGDGRLTVSELKAYLELIRLGTAAQTWVTVNERGRSLFHLLDADADGRLSYAELARAASRRKGDDVVPWQVELSFGGPAAAAWGGVPLPAARRPRPAAVKATDAPRWFRAMDHNGDGVLSPKEFVGPPERFRRLDADGDGVLTAEEAREA